MPIPPPPPPPPGPPPPPTLSQVGVTSLGGEVACPHMGPLARGVVPGEGWLWQGWGAPGGGGDVLALGPGEMLSCCSFPGEHRTTEAEPRGTAGPRGPPAGHL